jgi:hypothetical protein
MRMIKPCDLAITLAKSGLGWYNVAQQSRPKWALKALTGTSTDREWSQRERVTG